MPGNSPFYSRTPQIVLGRSSIYHYLYLHGTPLLPAAGQILFPFRQKDSFYILPYVLLVALSSSSEFLGFFSLYKRPATTTKDAVTAVGFRRLFETSGCLPHCIPAAATPTFPQGSDLTRRKRPWSSPKRITINSAPTPDLLVHTLLLTSRGGVYLPSSGIWAGRSDFLSQ